MSTENPTIAELIQTNPGYSGQVDLNLWFRNSAQNLKTMARYKPIASHRKSFERIAKSLDNNDKRVYLITGNYGTGKSHLALMLANYFAYPSTQPEIARFLDNYAQEDPIRAEELRLRRQKGRYLAALCDYDSVDDFGEVVLRAVLDALQEAGLAEALNTPYEEARRKLEQLEAEQQAGQALVDYYRLFESQLPGQMPGVNMKAFKEKLFPGMERGALEAFKRLHEEILRTPFTYQAGNLSAILKSTLQSPAFQAAFEGIVVFWDEFGYTLGNPNRLRLDVFQQFAQLCAEFDPTRGKLIFIAAAHKDFSAYAPAWAAADYSKISDRVAPVSLLPEGLEDVIGAIVQPRKDDPHWQNTVLPRANPIWSQWIPASKNSGIFDWLVDKPPVFRQKILEGVYPLHPMAVYAVIELARQVGSQNRTVFTFFASESDDLFEPGSYLWYIHNTSLLNGRGQLNFYTVERVFDYFRARLRTDNADLTGSAREAISNYESSLTQLQGIRNQNPLALGDQERIEAILRVLLIYDLIRVANSVENLLFGLNLPPAERSVLEGQLDDLIKYGVLHRNPTTKLYEFRRSDIFEVDRWVEEYKRERANELGNLAVELNSLAPLPRKDQYLEAKSYNAQHNEDKRLERRIVSLGDLSSVSTLTGQPASYFDLLEAEVEREVRRGGDFEGIALYVVCESQAEIADARDLAAKNTSPRLIVAVPASPVLLKDAILNLKAIDALKKSEKAQQFSTQDNALVHERETLFQAALDKLRNELLDNRKLAWLGAYGKALVVDPNRPDDPANRVMQSLYTRRTAFSHDDFNLIHSVRNFTQPHLSLVEAVNALLRQGQNLTIDSSQTENRGERRYLQRCLFQRGALSQLPASKGNITVVEVERDPKRFEPFLPALVDMLLDVRALQPGEKLPLRNFIQKYRQPPYGLGSIGLSLLFAVVLHFYGYIINNKMRAAAIGDLRVTDFDLLSEIVKGNYPDAFIQYRQIQPGEQALIQQVYGLFSDAPNAAQASVSTANAYEAVAQWYTALPCVTQVASFYQEESYGPARRLMNVLEKLTAQDPHAFVLGELQTVAGYDADELVTPERALEIAKTLETAKDQVEEAVERVETGIRAGVCTIFAIPGSTWDDLADGVRAWYNDLDANQQSVAGSWHNDASKPLIRLCQDLSNPRQVFLEKLPASPSYGFGAVRSWNADLSKDYLSKIKDGVQHVEANRIKVPSPVVEIKGQYRKDDKGNVFFSGPLTLRIHHPDPNVKVLLTDRGLDPQTASERIEFRGEKLLDIHALTQARRETITLRFLPQDGQGNLGVLETLAFYDETVENEIRVAKGLFEGKSTVKFVFPTTEAGFITSCRTFFESALETKIVDPERLEALVQEILEQIKQKSGGKE